MIKNLFSKVSTFAKQKPSLFIVIVLFAMVVLFYITYEALHLTSTPSFCKMCHIEHPSGPGGEYYTWEKSSHSYVDVTCIDCHGTPGLIGYGKAKMGGLYDLYGEIFKSNENKMRILTEGATSIEYAAKLVPSSRCLFCHSDEVNKTTREDTIMTFLGLPMRNIDSVVNPAYREKYGLPDLYKEAPLGVDPKHEVHMVTVGLACENCHQGVAHAGEFRNFPKMETCFTCHDIERTEAKAMPANDDCATCHTLVVNLQKGDFLQSQGIESSEWLMPSVDCLSCHEDAFKAPTVQNCIDCHEESYADMYNTFRQDFVERKQALTPIWKELLTASKKMNSASREKFNTLSNFYYIIDTDKSQGIHNTDLMTSIFDKAEELAKDLKEEVDKQK